MFLDLHVTMSCNLRCRHCYLTNEMYQMGHMSLKMAHNVIIDYLDLPYDGEKRVVLSGGEPTLYPHLNELIVWFHTVFNQKISIASNGAGIDNIIDVLWLNENVQIDLDGDKQAHDWLRGSGSYDQATHALELMQESCVSHSIQFNAHQGNKDTLDHVLDFADKTGCIGVNINLCQPLVDGRGLEPLPLDEFQELRDMVKERGFYYTKRLCYLTGCSAGLDGLAVLPDGTYWDCPRHQKVIGHYPDAIWDVLDRETRNCDPKEMCMRCVL